MKKNTINQTVIVLITAIALYFSGIHLASMEGIQNLFDGFVVMLFFIAVFPFLANAIRLTHNFIKSLFNVLAI